MKIVVFKKNASMIHSVVNIQFGFVFCWFVGFLGNAPCSPAGRRSPIILFVVVSSLLLLIGQHVFLNFTHHQNTL